MLRCYYFDDDDGTTQLQYYSARVLYNKKRYVFTAPTAIPSFYSTPTKTIENVFCIDFSLAFFV